MTLVNVRSESADEVAKEGIIMAISLKKQIREYTPLHILDEEATMPTSQVKTAVSTPISSMQIVVEDRMLPSVKSVDMVDTLVAQVEGIEVSERDRVYQEMLDVLEKAKKRAKWKEFWESHLFARSKMLKRLLAILASSLVLLFADVIGAFFAIYLGDFGVLASQFITPVLKVVSIYVIGTLSIFCIGDQFIATEL